MLTTTKVLLTVSCCLFTFAALAQEQPHKLSLKAGCGFASIPHIFHNFLSLGSVEWETTSVRGPWQAGINYAISRKLEVGVMVSKTRITDEGRYRDYSDPVPSPDQSEVIARKTTNYHTLLPYVTICWKKTDKMQMYSGYAQGWGFSKTEEWWHDREREKDNYTGLAFQLTAVGVRYGKRVAGYAELGFGFHGLINGGLSIQL